MKGISYMHIHIYIYIYIYLYLYIPSLLDLPPTTLTIPSPWVITVPWTELPVLCKLLPSYLFYTQSFICINPNLPICPPLPLPLCVHSSALCVCIYILGNRSICTIFLDSTYMHQYAIFVFLLLTYFILYDRF